MIDEREIVRRAVEALDPPEPAFERLRHRRDRKRRNQRIAAGVVGIAVFVAAVWIVTSVGSLDRSETSVVPGGDVTGPAETGLAPKPALNIPEVDYLLDLDTGETTPLPESIRHEEPNGYAISPDGSEVAYFDAFDAAGDGSFQVFVANLDGTHVRQITQDTEVDWFGTIEGDMPGWSPDGTKIAYVGHTSGDRTQVYVVDQTSGVTTQVTSEAHVAHGTQFSPDGSSIVYVAELSDPDRGEVRIVPATGGKSSLLVGGQELNASYISFSPDGSLLFYACGRPGGYAGICLANADGSDPRVIVAPGKLSSTSLSPDGARLAYQGGYDDVYIKDIATGETTWVATGAYPRWVDDHTLIVEDHPRCCG